MSNLYWHGIDLSKATFHAALAPVGGAPDDWPSLPNKCFPNSKEGIATLCAWLLEHGFDKQSTAGVCLEATGRLAWTFVAHLEDRLGPISIVNPARPVAYARSLGLRDKTDRIDACILALYGVANRPVPRDLPSPRLRELKELATHYCNERAELLACRNRLQEAYQSSFIRKQLAAKRRTLERRLEAIEAEMDKLIEQDPQMKADAQLIQTIPGVAEKTTRILLAQFGDLRQYTRNEIVALAGLYPKQFRSGTSVHRKPRLAKAGGARTRAALYMAALSARRYCPQLKRFNTRLLDTGKHNALVHGAIMRKLLLLIRTIVITQQPYDPNYA